MSPAPSRVVSRNRARSRAGSLPSGSGGTVRDRISAQIWASARRSAPARAAATRISSAWARNSAGIAYGPLGQLQGFGLGDGAGAEPGQQRLVVAVQGLDGLVLGGLRPGDPGHVHQPGPQRLLPVGLVPVLGVVRGQQRGQRRGEDRVGLDQFPDVLA